VQDFLVKWSETVIVEEPRAFFEYVYINYFFAIAVLTFYCALGVKSSLPIDLENSRFTGLEPCTDRLIRCGVVLSYKWEDLEVLHVGNFCENLRLCVSKCNEFMSKIPMWSLICSRQWNSCIVVKRHLIFRVPVQLHLYMA